MDFNTYIELFIKWYAEAALVCSILHSILPPWDTEAFQPFPRFQKYYKLFIYLLGYVAINARSTVWKQISVNNPTGLNSQTPAGQAKVGNLDKEIKEL